MLYVSFVEILAKSQEYLACKTKYAALGAAGFFFAGIIFTVILHIFVHKVEDFPFRELIVRRIMISCRRRRRPYSDLTEETIFGNTEEEQRATSSRTHGEQTDPENGEETREVMESNETKTLEIEEDTSTSADVTQVKISEEEKDKQRLKQMGVMTGLAIALHNFPEG